MPDNRQQQMEDRKGGSGKWQNGKGVQEYSRCFTPSVYRLMTGGDGRRVEGKDMEKTISQSAVCPHDSTAVAPQERTGSIRSQHKTDKFQALISALAPFNRLPLIICCYLCYILNL